MLRFARLAYFALVATILVIAIVPQMDAPVGVSNDKINHMLAFFVLAVPARLLWPDKGFWTHFLWLAGFGALIEVLQGAMGVGRDADWKDFVADVAAAAAGLGVARLILIARRKRK